jgi:2-polyprenyl-6-hydroxyphenyl methylase/3-demethylubiquinone-9 3-methyltransferase
MLSANSVPGTVSNSPAPCKICDGPADLQGVVGMNRPCQTSHAHRAPLSGAPIYDRRCAACGLLSTEAFDDWSIGQFRTHIYNDGCEAVDPDYRIKRPTDNATAVARSVAWPER